MLINNSIESIYNGVSEQSSEHRQNTQVKEMINAFPSIDKGLLRRNPTRQSYLSQAISYSPDMGVHAYDRGLAGESEEKYAVKMDTSGLEIVNVNSGDVYKEGSGITFEGNAKNYLYPYTGTNGYAATTVKDTTFIVNKEVRPIMAGTNAVKSTTTTTSKTIYEANINFGLGYDTSFSWQPDRSYMGPAKRSNVVLFGLLGEDKMAAGYVTFNVDGQSILVENLGARTEAYELAYTRIPMMSEFRANVASKLSAVLSSATYTVSTNTDGSVKIQRIDGSTINVTWSISYRVIATGQPAPAEWLGTDSDFLLPTTYANYTGNVVTTSNAYKKVGYIWIKGNNPTAPYSFTATITDENGNSVTATESTATTTEATATALAATISANANFSAAANGSVIKVTATNSNWLKFLDISDTYGNQASFGWTQQVQFTTDLPKSLGFAEAIVNVTGSGESGFDSFWLKYDNSNWVETLNPDVTTELDSDTMPHVLVRNADGNFTVKKYDGWKDRLVGDDDTNPVPSFMDSEENVAPTIRDIFFFKNRLGFITHRTVVMSEVGQYGNFWRTTVAALLDSDPIDTAVDTTKAIRLEYATYLEDRIMLFSDKVQFKLEGGKILSPTNVQISQTSAYEINKNVRPVYINDKIFFCVKRGGYTAVMQFQVKSSNTSSEAIDITAHVQSYIPENVTMISGSPVDNILYLSVDNSDTIFCYKYYDSGEERLQSAWFKYRFNGIIYRAFSLGRNLNLMIRRNNFLTVEDWVLGTGIWESAKTWDSSRNWISLPADLVAQNQFETSPIAPIDYTSDTFTDVADTDNATTIFTDVNFGEWVAEFDGKKDIRGSLKFKSVMISSEADSDFELYAIDNHRDDIRVIKSKYTVDRKPMIYGDAKNMEIGIKSSSNVGFRINTVNYEGNYNTRSKKY